MVILKPVEHVAGEPLIYTCSDCFNDHVNVWEMWVDDDEELCEKFKLSNSQTQAIRIWVDNKFKEGKISYPNIFTNPETVLECKNKFLSHLNDIKIMALYFDKDGRADILNKFEQNEKGLHLTLLKGVEETDNEKFLGFDYIGIDITTLSFHSFQCCYTLGKELSDKFGLTLNEFGLFDSNINSKQVLDYLNDESNGCEPGLWVISKVKLVMNE